jgi:glucosamine-6-phosphate deaminase
MRVIVKDSPAEIGDYVAAEIASFLREKPNAVLGLATGSSPLPVYASLAVKAREGEVDFSMATTFNLDEYLDCPDEKQTYRYFMDKNLFSLVPIKKDSIHFPSLSSLNSYDKEIASFGGIDFQLLGIGVNGHIGFNEPLTPFDSLTHIIRLTESTRLANSRFFPNLDSVPHQAISMGLKTILAAKRIVVVADDLSKIKAIAFLLSGNVDPLWPASLLNQHPNVEIVLTKELFLAAQKEKPARRIPEGNAQRL